MTAMKKGTYVSRAAFTKCDEKRKALLREIYILVHPKYTLSFERMEIVSKYRKLYQQDMMLHAALREMIENDPELLKPKKK